MDVSASELGSKPPESMLFADDLVLCETSREKVEQELERWGDQFERHGLRIISTTNLAACVCVSSKFDQFLPVRFYFVSKRPENFVGIA